MANFIQNLFATIHTSVGTKNPNGRPSHNDREDEQIIFF